MTRPMRADEHIDQAKSVLAWDEPDARLATAHALVAIAELMAINVTDTIIDATGRGAMAAAEAIGTVLNVVNPAVSLGSDICANCGQHHDKHSNDDLSCPCHYGGDGSIVFSTTRRYTPKQGQR